MTGKAMVPAMFSSLHVFVHGRQPLQPLHDLQFNYFGPLRLWEGRGTGDKQTLDNK